MIIKRDIKHWFQRRIRGWSDDECWNLDYSFIEWINSRFKKYREQTIADLTFHKFMYKRKKYTQGELIDKIIQLTDDYKIIANGDFNDESLLTIKDEIFDIFKLIFWTMWW